ncbi:hypothetical protein AAG906_008878 [Vitis piasezkii]
MKILVCLQQPNPHITKPSPWNPRAPTPIATKDLNLRPRNWKLHAEAKGFGVAPGTILEKKTAQKETVPRKNSGNGDDDDDEKIPQVVFDRMIVRILFFVGAPMGIGVALLNLFGAVKDQHLWDVPVWLPFLTTFIAFGASALGIAYGTLSTSWDAEKKGSLLGLEEAQQNWVDVWKEEEDSKR